MHTQEDIALLTRLRSPQLKLLIVSIEFILLIAIISCYACNTYVIIGLLPVIIIHNLFSLLPLPYIWFKLVQFEKERIPIDSIEKNGEHFALDAWERACIGYYLVANIGGILFIIYFSIINLF